MLFILKGVKTSWKWHCKSFGRTFFDFHQAIPFHSISGLSTNLNHDRDNIQIHNYLICLLWFAQTPIVAYDWAMAALSYPNYSVSLRQSHLPAWSVGIHLNFLPISERFQFLWPVLLFLSTRYQVFCNWVKAGTDVALYDCEEPFASGGHPTVLSIFQVTSTPYFQFKLLKMISNYSSYHKHFRAVSCFFLYLD